MPCRKLLERVLTTGAAVWAVPVWAVLFFTLLPGNLSAQVAAPDFSAGTARFYSPRAGVFNGTSLTADNPAVSQWRESSRVGGGTVLHMMGSDDGAMGYPLSFEGAFAGAQLVGERISLSLDQITVRDSETFLDNHMRRQRIQVGMKVAEFLSFGFGGGTYRHKKMEKDPLGGPDIPVELESSDELIGFSLRMKEVVFLGYGAGRESLTRYDNDPASLNPELNLDRPFYQYGLAISTRGKLRLYLAADTEEREAFRFEGVERYGFKTFTVTVQIKAGDSLMVGGSKNKWRANMDNPGPLMPESETETAEAAWVPKSGMSLGTRYSRTTTVEYSPLLMRDVKSINATRAVSVGFMF